jgi:hypothetical protein
MRGGRGDCSSHAYIVFIKRLFVNINFSKKRHFLEEIFDFTLQILSKCLFSLTYLMKFRKMPIIGSMKGMTVSEMAEALNLPPATIKKRLLRAGRKPFSQEALYTKDDFEAIKEVPARGRPPKAKPEAPAKVVNPAKPGKKPNK